ncbi:MAG TPA: peptidase U32 [Cyanobacteria bacterium UBA8530]|nr:peptidase U32 [Cyanobacteria bacterium UBA8530]
MKKPELIMPAGSMEKLRYAIAYGADAVYLGTSEYSLRSAAAFDWDSLSEAILYAKKKKTKSYLTLNAYPHPAGLRSLEKDLGKIRELEPDALVVADPGVLETVLPLGIPIHLSTQANTLNARSARFWVKNGVSRIILARELSLNEISEIHQEAPEVELEAFVHGAMCMAYSGRCLLSNFLAERDANQGACAQTCRWNYRLIEEKRPGESFPVEEDGHGSYILSSRDLCMIEHLPLLTKAGVRYFKVEGRAKSAYYAAGVAKAYRAAIDRLGDDSYQVEDLLEELILLPHRGFSTGFFFGAPGPGDHAYLEASAHRPREFAGRILSWENGLATVEVRNTIVLGNSIELLDPEKNVRFEVAEIRDEEGKSLPRAHPGQKISLPTPEATEWSLLRTEGCPCDC